MKQQERFRDYRESPTSEPKMWHSNTRPPETDHYTHSLSATGLTNSSVPGFTVQDLHHRDLSTGFRTSASRDSDSWVISSSDIQRPEVRSLESPQQVRVLQSNSFGHAKARKAFQETTSKEKATQTYFVLALYNCHHAYGLNGCLNHCNDY